MLLDYAVMNMQILCAVLCVCVWYLVSFTFIYVGMV